MYIVNADTSALSGTQGYVDFQFNPIGVPPSSATTATISAFATDGTLGAALPNIGDVTGGPLPTSVTIANDDPGLVNEFTQAITFGTSMSFDVTLSGPDVGAPSSGDTFFFTLQDTSFNGLSTGPNGALVTVQVNADGSTTPTAYSPPAGAAGPTATVNVPSVVPEPSTLVGAFTAIGGILACRAARRIRNG